MGADLGGEIRDFIAASQAREAGRRVRRRVAVASLAVLSVLCGILAVFALFARNQAVYQEGVAVVQKKEADTQRTAAQRESINAKASAQEADIQREAAQRESIKANASAKEAQDRRAEVERQLRHLEWTDYFAKLAQVRDDVEAGNVHSARFHLDKIRHWEMCSWDYDYLAAQIHGRQGLRRMPISGEDYRKGAISPDGQLLAIAGTGDVWNKQTNKTDKVPQITLFDFSTLKSTRVIRGGAPFTCVAFFPDGKRLIAGTAAGTLEAYNVATGALQLSWDKSANVSNSVFAVVVSSDGNSFASGAGGVVRLWDVATKRMLRSLSWRIFGDCTGLAFNGDGQLLAATFTDRSLQVWDTRTGESRVLIRGPMGDNFKSMAFHRDGRSVVVGTDEGVLYLWDIVNNALLGLRAVGPAPVSAVSFSRDGSRIASGHGDGAVRLWDGKLAKAPTLLLGHEGAVRDVLFTPDARSLVSFEAEHFLGFPDLRVWSVEPFAVAAPLVTADLRVGQFVPNGRYMTVDKAGKLTIWDTTSHKELGTAQLTLPAGADICGVTLDGLTFAVRIGRSIHLLSLRPGRAIMKIECPAKANEVLFNRSGRLALIRHEDETAWTWDVSGDKPLVKAKFTEVHSAFMASENTVILAPEKRAVFAEFDLESHKKLIETTTNDKLLGTGNVSRDGRFFAAVEGTGLTVWRKEVTPSPTWTRVGTIYPASAPMTCEFTPESDRLFISGYDYMNQGGMVESWCLSPDLPVQTFRKYRYVARTVEFSPDGRRMAVIVGGTGENVLEDVEIYDDGDLFRERHADNYGDITDFVCDPVGNRLLSAGGKRSYLTAINGSSGRMEPGLDPAGVCPKDAQLDVLAASPDGATLATGDAAGKQIVVWDTKSNRATFSLTGLPDAVTRIRFSPDGRRVAALLKDKSAGIWELGSRKLEHGLALRGPSPPLALAWSPDGSTIAVACGDEVELLDPAGGKRRDPTLHHPKPVRALAFSNDGRVLLSGCEDGVIRTWDHVAGKLAASLTGHKSAITDLAVRPRSSHLATVDSQGAVMTWDFAKAVQIHTIAEADRGRYPGSLIRLAWFPDGKRLAGAGSSGITVWTVPL